MALVYRYLEQVRNEGYLKTYADAGTRDSLRIYEKLGYRADETLVQLESGEPRLPEHSSGASIVPIEVDRLLAERGPFMNTPYMWSRQQHFLRHNTNLLEFLGSYREGRLEAYAVLTGWPGNTTVLDFRTTEATQEAGWDLLRHMVVHEYPRPFVFTMIPRPSPMYRLLEAADFAEIEGGIGGHGRGAVGGDVVRCCGLGVYTLFQKRRVGGTCQQHASRARTIDSAASGDCRAAQSGWNGLSEAADR